MHQPQRHPNMDKAKPSQSLEFPVVDVTILQNHSECPPSRFNWKALKTVSAAVKIGQMIAGIVAIALTRSRGGRTYNQPFEGFPELPFVFYTINVTLVTLAILTDTVLTARPLQKAFTPKLWCRVELWFTGLTAVGFHLISFTVLTTTFYYPYNIHIKQVASGFGFLAAVLYGSDWWNNFARRQHFEEGPQESHYYSRAI